MFPRSMLAGIHIGEVRTVRIDARGRELQGRVVEIVPSSDPATRTVVVRIHLEDTRDIVPGMFGRLLIPTASEQVLTVPASAMIRAGQLTMVDVVDQGRVQRRTVQLGRDYRRPVRSSQRTRRRGDRRSSGSERARSRERRCMSSPHESLTIRIVRKFLESNLSMVFILVSLAAGAIALVVTPREEEPQIIVAAANVMVSFPGHTPQDVEQLVSTPLERMLYQVPGVEYVYSRSMPGQSIVTVRFYVGQPLEPSYVKLIRKLNENMDRTAPGAAGWVVKPIDVDDVPIVTFTLTSGSRDDYWLRRMADEIVSRLQGVNNAGSRLRGGRPPARTPHPAFRRTDGVLPHFGAGSEPRHPGVQLQRARGDLRPQRPGCARPGGTVYRGRAGFAESRRRRLEWPARILAGCRRGNRRPG